MAVAQQEIEQARALAQQGNSVAAVALLSQLIQRDASNVAAWLALSDVVADPERAEYCLQKVLSLDPGNAAATERLSKYQGGSLSVGMVRGLDQEGLSGDAPDPAARSEALQDTDSDETGHSTTVPEISQASAIVPEQQEEDPAPETLAEASNVDAAAPKGSQENEAQLEAAPAVPEVSAPKTPADATNADAIGLGNPQDNEVQLGAAPTIPDEPAQEPSGRSVGRTDLILIGLTVLAGIVLCALVSAALFS